MLPKKIINSKTNDEVARELIMNRLSRFGISSVGIEKTPLGMKVVVRTTKPGFLLTRANQTLKDLSKELGVYFKQESPHIDVEQVDDPLLDPESVADSIAFKIAKFGPMKYKVVAHKAMDDIMAAGAKGVEIEIGGVIKERAAHFKFRPHGSVMPKTGQLEDFGVRKAKKQLVLKRGSIGIKVTIVAPTHAASEVEFKNGRKSEGSGAGAPENEHKEDAGAAAS
ncbi:MAG: hypothetical protein M1441_01345 [Candidatus Parvarchaeota archaeon]|jgi:ribosomal protein uS3|nr:hypothetical protein [Candidatus Parvarchaeota archaeon]